MVQRMLAAVLVSSIGLALASCATPQSPPPVETAADISCQMTFSLTGWAAIVKHARGHGVISCANGASQRVDISAHGGGLTLGKYHIDNGHGSFTGVHSIKETYGEYVQAGVHAGATQSGKAQVLSKGTVSLALAGSGQGVGLGVSVGIFKIEPAD